MIERAAGKTAELKHYGCHLGYDCNRSCLFCSSERLERAASKVPGRHAGLCRSLRTAGADGFKSLAFTGGEPTLDPDLPGLMKAASRAGFEKIILLSNGTRFADKAYAKRLAGCGLGFVNLNVPSHDARVFDCLTGEPGGFASLLKAIENLSGLGIKLSAVCVDKGLCPPFLEHFIPCALKGYEARVLGEQRRRKRTSEPFVSIYPEWSAASAADVAGRDRIKFAACGRCLYFEDCPGVEKNYIRVFGEGEFEPVKKEPQPFWSGLKGKKLALARVSFAQAMQDRGPC